MVSAEALSYSCWNLLRKGGEATTPVLFWHSLRDVGEAEVWVGGSHRMASVENSLRRLFMFSISQEHNSGWQYLNITAVLTNSIIDAISSKLALHLAATENMRNTERYDAEWNSQKGKPWAILQHADRKVE